MGRGAVTVWLVGWAAVACGRIGFEPRSGSDAGDAQEDAGGVGDAGPPRDGAVKFDGGDAATASTCTPWVGAWMADAPEILLHVDGAEYESPVPSPDCLTLYFTDNADILAMTRPTLDAPFEAPVRVPDVSTTLGREMSFSVSSDDLEGFLSRDAAIWRATRATTTDPFTVVEDTGLVGADAQLSGDGLRVYFDANSDIAYAERSDRTSPFGPTQIIAELTTPGWEHGVFVSRNERFVLLGAERGSPSLDIFMASRASRSDPFSTPILLTPLVFDGGPDGHPSLCELTCEVFYQSTLLPRSTLMRTRLHPE